MKNVNYLQQKISIKTTSLPQRCEICHQVDCFDASTNHCSRCANCEQISIPHCFMRLSLLRNFNWQNSDARSLAITRNILTVLLVLTLALILYLWHLENIQLLDSPYGEDFAPWGYISISMGEIIGYPVLIGSIIGVLVGCIKYFVSLPNDHNTGMRILCRYR